MNPVPIKSLANRIAAIADDIEVCSYCVVQSTITVYQLRRIARQLSKVANQSSEFYQPDSTIQTVANHCRSLAQLAKQMSGTPYEMPLRKSIFELLNMTPDIMRDLIKPIPKNLKLTCSTNN